MRNPPIWHGSGGVGDSGRGESEQTDVEGKGEKRRNKRGRLSWYLAGLVGDCHAEEVPRRIRVGLPDLAAELKVRKARLVSVDLQSPEFRGFVKFCESNRMPPMHTPARARPHRSAAWGHLGPRSSTLAHL